MIPPTKQLTLTIMPPALVLELTRRIMKIIQQLQHLNPQHRIRQIIILKTNSVVIIMVVEAAVHPPKWSLFVPKTVTIIVTSDQVD